MSATYQIVHEQTPRTMSSLFSCYCFSGCQPQDRQASCVDDYGSGDDATVWESEGLAQSEGLPAQREGLPARREGLPARREGRDGDGGGGGGSDDEGSVGWSDRGSDFGEGDLMGAREDADSDYSDDEALQPEPSACGAAADVAGGCLQLRGCLTVAPAAARRKMSPVAPVDTTAAAAPPPATTAEEAAPTLPPSVESPRDDGVTDAAAGDPAGVVARAGEAAALAAPAAAVVVTAVDDFEKSPSTKLATGGGGAMAPMSFDGASASAAQIVA